MSAPTCTRTGCAKRRLPESGWRLSCGYDETYVGAVARSRITSPGKKLTGVERKAGPRTDRLSLNGGLATPTRSREGPTGADALMNRPPTRSSPTGSPPWRLLRRSPAQIAHGLRSPLIGEGIDQDRESRRHHRGGADAGQASQRDVGCPAAPPARTPAMRQRTRRGPQPGTVDVPTGRLRSRPHVVRGVRPALALC